MAHRRLAILDQICAKYFEPLLLLHFGSSGRITVLVVCHELGLLIYFGFRLETSLDEAQSVSSLLLFLHELPVQQVLRLGHLWHP